MSAVVARPAARPVRRSPLARTIRHQLAAQFYVGAWFWAIILAGVVVATVIASRFGPVEVSIMQYARQGTLWFPFSMMIFIVAAGLTPHVAAGMTRRSFAAAAAVVSLIVAAANALVLVGLLQVERAVYAAAGWTQSLTDGGLDLVSSTTDVGPLLVALVVTGAAATASGLLVGVVYYRVGGWWGTLTLPLTVGPILVVGQLLSGTIGPFGVPVLGKDTWAIDTASGLALRTAVSAALIAILLAVFNRLTRGAPLGKPVV
ncbi:hypothetical protein [Cellulomonas timonensis]|uniref:hypothetical protein n=1 Tax=Cellulomonas timonensis TaxID=1689271 RepID=UPI000832E653|nr:hypothetical protein [Cellulomonas timonensis]